jgi:tetratricopeptide (TPR) repeat protein
MASVEDANRNAKNLQEEVWRNMELYEANYSKAIEILKNALRVEPNNTTTLTNLGAALSDFGRHKLAIPYLEKAISLGSKDRHTYFNMGVACINCEGYRSKSTQYFNDAKGFETSDKTWEAYFDPHGH